MTIDMKEMKAYDLDTIIRETHDNLLLCNSIVYSILNAVFNAANHISTDEPIYLIDFAKDNVRLSQLLVNQLQGLEKNLGVLNYYQNCDYFNGK